MYKYQYEILNELEKTFKVLETKTEDRKSFKVGYLRDEIRNSNGTAYIERTGDLFIRLNYEDRYLFVHDYSTEFSSISETAYLSIDKNIFLKLNKFIEDIYASNKQKKEFAFNLKKELEALNKAL